MYYTWPYVMDGAHAYFTEGTIYIHVPYVLVVSTPIPSERKPYMPYAMDVGQPYFFKGQNCFLT